MALPANNIHDEINYLLEQLVRMQEEYSQALKDDSILSIKKEIRIRIREIQVQLTDLSEKISKKGD
jgi:hypothetical protein